MLALGIAFVLENLPTQLYGHEYASILKPDPSYIEYFGGKKRRSIILDLPSTVRSEEHTSELQSLMRISYAVFCLKKKKSINQAHIEEKRDLNVSVYIVHE